MGKYENGNFYQLPKNLHRVVSNTYQLAILSYLRQCENNGEAWPSYNKMAQGLMSRWKAIKTIKALIEMGYLTKEPNAYHSNTYHIDIEKLVSDTNQYATPTSKPHQPTSVPHQPGVVSDTHPNKTNKNNTKEQEERDIDNYFIKTTGQSLKKVLRIARGELEVKPRVKKRFEDELKKCGIKW